MPAFACLRILLHPAKLEKPGGDALALASKIVLTFLESHWAYPKRFTQISQTSYTLSDSRAGSIPPKSLQTLAAELQRQFFGSGDSGEASLILFVGEQNETSRCALFPNLELRMLTNGDLGQLNSVLKSDVWKITARAIAGLQVSPATGAPPNPGAADEMLACFRGVFLSAKQEFIGSIGSRWRADDPRHMSILDGPSHFPTQYAARFDQETAEICVEETQKHGGLSGLLFLPVCYTSLVKRPERETYAAFLRVLERLPKGQLTATLYDVPRDPFYAVIGEITAFLHERFGAIDLLIADPGFNVASLSQSKVRSISLCLPNAEDALRQSALKRFAENRDAFRAKQILPMVSNVRSAAEITACGALKIPLVSGKAVTDILTAPLGMFPYMTDGLPLTDPSYG